VSKTQQAILIIPPAPEHGPFIRCGASHLIHFHIHAHISNPFCHIYVCFFLDLSSVHIHVWLSILYHSPSPRAWHFQPLRRKWLNSLSYTCIYFKFILSFFTFIRLVGENQSFRFVQKIYTYMYEKRIRNICMNIKMDETTHFIQGMFILCDASHFIHFHIHVYISNPFFICICIFLGQLQEWIRNRRTSTLLSQPQSMALSSAVARVIWFIFTYMHIFQIHFRIYVCFFLNCVCIYVWFVSIYMHI